MDFSRRLVEINERIRDLRTVGEDISDYDYFKGNQNYTSASQLKKLINKGNLHFDKYLTYGDKPTEALFFGNVVHTMILEPGEFDNRYMTFDESYIIKNLDKEYKNPRASKEYKEKLQEYQKSFDDAGAVMVQSLLQEGIANTEKKIVIPKDWYKQAEEMYESIQKVPIAMDMLQNSVKEKAFFSEMAGIKVKSKIDIIMENAFSDLKTISDVPTPKNVNKAIHNYDYDLSMATYAVQTGCKNASFIFVEKTHPYTVGVYQITDDTLERGLNKLETALGRYANFLELKNNNQMQGYFTGLV